jgi:hypothetical protein
MMFSALSTLSEITTQTLQKVATTLKEADKAFNSDQYIKERSQKDDGAKFQELDSPLSATSNLKHINKSSHHKLLQ